MKKSVRISASLFVVLLTFCMLFGCGSAPTGGNAAAAGGGSTTQETPAEQGAAAASDTPKEDSSYVDAWKKRDGLTLKQVVAVSRHNLRAPQDKNMETLANSTPHTWIEWTAAGSELTTKGGVAETIMGEFFRKWLEDEGLIPQNYIPQEGAVRFYSNPRQRTLATTQYFSSGMLPVANVKIEYHGEYDTRDEVYMPRFGYVSNTYTDAATEEIAKLGKDKGLAGVDADLQESYDLISEVMDYKNSKDYEEGADLKVGDMGYAIAQGEEPKVTGSLATANVFSDALVLQYYEAKDVADAAFGKELTYDQWKTIAAAKNAFGDRRYDSKLVGVDCARLLAGEVSKELGKDGRLFTFMCGHDSNQSSLLHALGVSEYELPDTIETKTPIGGKILFEVWENEAHEKYCNVRYVYATTEQIRNLSMLDLATPPASFDLDFAGISRNADGLYALADVQKLLADVGTQYEQLPVDYPEGQQLAAAA